MSKSLYVVEPRGEHDAERVRLKMGTGHTIGKHAACAHQQPTRMETKQGTSRAACGWCGVRAENGMRNGPKRCRKYFCTMITVSLINASSDCSSGVSVGSAVEFGDLLVLPLASAPALTPLPPPSGCDGVSPSFAARGACRSAMLRRLCAVAVSTMMGYANQTTAAETIAHLLQVYRRGDRRVKKRIEMREGLHRKEKRADEILMFFGMLFLPPKHGEGVRGWRG